MDKQPEHMTPDELAERWKKSRGTLANWRSKGFGPAYVKLGKTILYPLEAVLRFEAASKVA